MSLADCTSCPLLTECCACWPGKDPVGFEITSDTTKLIPGNHPGKETLYVGICENREEYRDTSGLGK